MSGTCLRTLCIAQSTVSSQSAKAPTTRRTQYFEMFGLRAIYHDGWVACTTPPTPLGVKDDPPNDPVTYAEAVMSGDGRDPHSLPGDVYAQVLAEVERAFARHIGRGE